MKIYSIVQARSRFKCNPCSTFLFFTSRAFNFTLFHIFNESIPSMEYMAKFDRIVNGWTTLPIYYPVTILGSIFHQCILKITRKFPYNFLFAGLQGPDKASKLAPRLFPFESLNLIICIVVPVVNAHSLNKKKQKHKTNDGSESHD